MLQWVCTSIVLCSSYICDFFTSLKFVFILECMNPSEFVEREERGCFQVFRRVCREREEREEFSGEFVHRRGAIFKFSGEFLEREEAR